MTEREAALTSYHEYVTRLKGFDMERRDRWEMKRWEMWQHMLLSPNIKEYNKPKTPQAFMRFPWEKDPNAGVTQEDCKISQELADNLTKLVTSS